MLSLNNFNDALFDALEDYKNENKPDDEQYEVRMFGVIAWLIMIIIFIVWGWDQLWGVPGFANNTCALENFGTYNSTDGADNNGYKLFTSVERWIYIYIIIEAFACCILCWMTFIISTNKSSYSVKHEKQKSTTSTRKEGDRTNMYIV